MLKVDEADNDGTGINIEVRLLVMHVAWIEMKTLNVLKDICTSFYHITRSRSQCNQQSINFPSPTESPWIEFGGHFEFENDIFDIFVVF